MENKKNQKRIFSINAKGLTKRFNAITLFKDLDIYLNTGRSLAITGANGAGKSTLLEIIANLRQSTKGEITYAHNDLVIAPNKIYTYIGFSSFRINPYNELTGLENIFFSAREIKKNENKIEEFLVKFNLYKDKDKRVKFYSSGMKQRLRYLLAALNNPPILALDEPGANLDKEGKDIIYSDIRSKKNGKIIIIATNEEEEAALCNERIKLGE